MEKASFPANQKQQHQRRHAVECSRTQGSLEALSTWRILMRSSRVLCLRKVTFGPSQIANLSFLFPFTLFAQDKVQNL